MPPENPQRESGTPVDFLQSGGVSGWEIFELLPVSAAVVGPTGQITRVNRRWREFAVENGLEDLSTIAEGAPYLECCRQAAQEGDEFAAQAVQGIMDILQGNADYFSLEYPCHSQAVKRWFLMTATPAGSNHVITLHLDITTRRLAEEALGESERKFRLIAETIDDAFWITTPGMTKILYVSPAYEKIWGRRVQDIYQNPSSLLDAVHPEDRQLVAARFAEHSNPSWNQQYRIQRPDGSIRWIEDRGFPAVDSQGRIILLTSVATDVTNRKQMEDELRKAKDELELRVRERTQTLEDANAALRFLLRQREEDKREYLETALANLRYSVRPYLEKLRACRLSEAANAYLKIVETRLNDLSSSFIRTLANKYLDLTPMEIRVAELIKEGRSTKEIGELLYLSPGTIRSHRENLRRKLGIKGKPVNLFLFLKNLK